MAPSFSWNDPDALKKLIDDISATKVDMPEEGAKPTSESFPPVQTSSATPAVDTTATPKPPRSGYGAGLGDLDLQGAQAKARRASRNANIGRAGSELAAAMGGYQADTKFWDNKEEQGKQGVQNFLQRRGAADQELNHNGAMLKATTEQDDNDPKSDTSQLARELTRKGLPGIAESLGPRFDGMSAAQIKEQFPFMKELIDGQTKKKAKELSVNELTAQKTEAQKLFPNVDFSKFESAESIREFMKSAGLVAGEQGKNTRFTKGDESRSADRDQRERLGAQRRELALARQDIQRNTQAYKQAQNEVNGLEPDAPDTPPLTSEEKNKVTDQIAATRVATRAIEELKALAAKNGGSIINRAGNDYAEFKTKLQLLKPMVSAAGKLGNFTVAHENNVGEMIDDPDKLVNLLNSGRLNTQLDAVSEDLSAGLHDSIGAIGHHFKQAGDTKTERPYMPEVRNRDVQKNAVAGGGARDGDEKTVGGVAMVRRNGSWEAK